MKAEETDEAKKMTAQQLLIESMEKPTIEYIWKGKRFIKDKDGHRIPSEKGRQKKKGVMVATVIDDKVAIGFTLCNLKMDRFNYVKENQEPVFALEVALKRATKWANREFSEIGSAKDIVQPNFVPIPHSIVANLNNFVEKCRRYKRYEGMKFPGWVDCV